MEEQDTPECSREIVETDFMNSQVEISSIKENNSTNTDTANRSVEADQRPENRNLTQSFSTSTITSRFINQTELSSLSHNDLSISSPPPTELITTQPRPSSNRQLYVNHVGQPQTLFLQALSKLNDSAISTVAFIKINKQSICEIIRERTKQIATENPIQATELTPPDSLSSAPPSYSYVLKQIAFRRRPRIVGTFIPSPSFVQQTPPPNYAAAFDIYFDNLPPPPTRVYNFGFTPTLAVCPNCGFTGMTVVTSKITLCTHLCAITLCILCCWICAPLPYILRSCKDVSHYCRNCRSYLGMYCHTNPNAMT